MRIHSSKPLGLVFGNDPKLMKRLGEKYKASMEFKLAKASDCALLHRMANVRVAIVLWSHQATELAHRIQSENPGIPVLVEGNRRGFRSPIERNGFAATFDKAESREGVIEELENILSEESDAAFVSKFPDQEARLSLESFLTHLPQVAASLDDESRLTNALLAAILGVTRSNQGGLFLRDRTGANYGLVASRNLPSALECDLIGTGSGFCAWISKAYGHVITDMVSSPADSLLKRSGCNLILPLLHNSEILGWFLLKMPGVVTGPVGDLLQITAFFAIEALKQSHHAHELKDDCKRWQEICSRMTEAAVWVDDDGTIKVLNEGNGILKWKGLSTGTRLSDLRSSHLKSAIQMTRHLKNSAVAVPVSVKESDLMTRVDALKSGGVLLTVRRNWDGGLPEYGAPGWRKAVLLLVSEDRIANHRNHELLSTVRELASGAASQLVSLEWIAGRLESNKRIRLGLHRIPNEGLTSLRLPAHCAARIFLILADVVRSAGQIERLDLVLSHCPGRKALTLDFPVSLPQGTDNGEPFAELALLGGQSDGMEIQTAAFGFRLIFQVKTVSRDTLGSKSALTTEALMPQAGEFVLQKAVELPTNGTNGIHDGPTVTGSHHRRAARVS